MIQLDQQDFTVWSYDQQGKVKKRIEGKNCYHSLIEGEENEIDF